MDSLNQQIESHYHKSDLYETILNALKEKGVPLDNVVRTDISAVDEFHVRAAAVSKELADSIEMKGKKVLDVGCGLGGPCRMLADDYSCEVTGIDLSHGFIRTAQKLSRLVGLGNQTTFVQGNATDLPFEDNSFDVVWTQHVQMNIPDKEKFYSEIHRVLKSGGHFLFYDILKKGDEEVSYPMPWASKKELSFLFKREELDDMLAKAGFLIRQTKDQTQQGVDFFETLFERLKENGPPKLGLNLLMGESTKPKLMSLLEHLKGKKLEILSGVCQK